MGKDPAFLFYPGDYLRDTQCLSEKTQVSYDRIMCEHMRNICIRHDQLKFFTKKLNNEEKEELLNVLTKCEDGYYIEWVAESIDQRRKYSESRRKNRTKNLKRYDKHMKTYVEHMENENENENVVVIENKEKEVVKKEKFIEPTVLEVENYFIQIGLDAITANQQAKTFLAYWQEMEWKDKNKRKVKDWKRRCVTWKSNISNNKLAAIPGECKATHPMIAAMDEKYGKPKMDAFMQKIKKEREERRLKEAILPMQIGGGECYDA